MRPKTTALARAALALPLVVALAACGEPRHVGGVSGGDAQCSSCHLSASTLASGGAGASSASAPASAAAHAAHVLGGAVAGPIACGECHRVPEAVGSPGHMDGRVDVAFSQRAGGTASSFDRDSKSCAVTCHGSANPVWTQAGTGQARCGSCHGLPPTGGKHPVTGASCATCHPATVKPDGTLNVAGGAHLNGRPDVAGGGGPIACGSCHGIPPPSPHTTSTACGSCHEGYTSTSVNAALHQNGTKDVRSVEAACGSCHGIPPPAPHTASTACGNCHAGYTATAVNTALHQNGKKDVLSAEAACGSCHGIPPPAPHTTSRTCGSCHSGYTATTVNAALHQNGRKDVLSVEASCGACHGIPPPAPHTTSMTCGSCHQGYTATTVNATLHQNGRKDVTAQACGSCHAIPPTTGEHRKHVVGEGISCGRCHAGASTTSPGTGHQNGRVDVVAPGWSAGTKSCSNSCHGNERWY